MSPPHQVFFITDQCKGFHQLSVDAFIHPSTLKNLDAAFYSLVPTDTISEILGPIFSMQS